jgi:hypothetical protein
MAFKSWTETRLWKRISKSKAAGADVIRAGLHACMPDIETVLSAGGTAPSDFTLHDAGHAFRVAEQMTTNVMPESTFKALNMYELMFLLLSGYLHDIGMTPQQRKVKEHYQLLPDGSSDAISQQEKSEFQAWLDQRGDEATIPLSNSIPSGVRIQLANELVTHYVRFRHNDWSEDWIRSYFDAKPLTVYDGWLDDLVALCRSHHEGYGALAGPRFDPRPVGSHSSILNLRYLAAVLRVADILDFDPERTPEVILRQRDISPGSLIYWHKDKGISMRRENDRILISARPSSARIQRAIAETVDAIDQELRVCNRLAHDVRFDRCPGLDKRLPHEWSLATEVHRSIVPKEGTYEYIDGSFRPNTAKLLQLLSGTELYGNTIAAVRELLQNSFDAIKEDIARRKLSDPASRRVDLEPLYRVELRVESSPGRRLACLHRQRRGHDEVDHSGPSANQRAWQAAGFVAARKGVR